MKNPKVQSNEIIAPIKKFIYYPGEMIRFANCAGPMAYTQLGVIPSLAEREVVEGVYRRYYSN